MPEPELSNLALAKIVRGLERLKSEADKGKLPALSYLIGLALREARERKKTAG